MVWLKRSLCGAVATLLLAGSASAGTILVDFETIPGVDGLLGTADDLPMPIPDITWIRDELSPAGITFSQGTLFNGSFFDGNSSNHFISSTNPIGTFSIPVYGISIESYSMWNATLYAYDVSGKVIASDRILNKYNVFERTTLSLATNVAIAGFATHVIGVKGCVPH